MSEIDFLKVLMSTGLLERASITSDLEESVQSTEAHYLVKISCVMSAASMFVSDETDGLLCSPQYKTAVGEK